MYRAYWPDGAWVMLKTLDQASVYAEAHPLVQIVPIADDTPHEVRAEPEDDPCEQ